MTIYGGPDDPRMLESHHRTRNVLAVMRSVFQRTVESGTSLDEVAAHYLGRFDTLAPFLTGRGMDEDGTYDLETLVWDELLRYAPGDTAAVEVAGPPVRLPHDFAQPIALAMHELATNAVKFGALDPMHAGAVSVTWAFSDDDLVLTWREEGRGIVASAPRPLGFGRTFIEDGLLYQIGAKTSFEFGPGLVLSTIRLPRDLLKA